MKINFRTILRGALPLAVLLICGRGALIHAALPVSPVGTWDFLLSGSHGQKGMAFLTFSDDGTNRTFTGFQLLVGTPTSGTEDIITRNSVGDVTRDGFKAQTASGAG